MKRLLIWLLVLIALTSISYASDGCFVNENCTWWATITSGGQLYDADSANVTIFDPDGNIVVNNVEMTKINKTFIYVTTHNISGNYLGTATFYDAGVALDTATQSLEVKEDKVQTNSTMMAIIIGIIAIAGLMFYASNQVTSEKKIVLSRALEKILLYFGALGFLIVAWYFMIEIVKNSVTYAYLYNPLNTFFIILCLIVFAITMNYIYHVVIELTINRINGKKSYGYEEDDEEY